MRKLFGIGLAIALTVAIATPTALAFTFQVGDNLGKLSDWGSFYNQETGDPLPLGVFEEGNLDRTLFSVTDLYTPPIEIYGNNYYQGTPELIGLVYDLQIGDVSVLRAPGTNSASDPGKFEVDLVSAGQFATDSSPYVGGRVDVWLDSTTDFTPAGSGGYPWDWAGATGPLGPNWWVGSPFDAGEYDTFPTATDGTALPILSGTLVDPAGDGVLLSLTLDFEDGTGNTSQGYIHLLYNNSGATFDSAYLGGAAEIAFFNGFKFYPNQTIPYEPVFDDPATVYDPQLGAPYDVYWATSSQDPINFTILPEPTSLALLGSGLLGLLGYSRRRSKK